VLKFEPEIGQLFLGAVDEEVDGHDVLPGNRVGLGAVDRFVLEKMLLNPGGELGLDLLRGGAGIDADHDAEGHTELRILVAGHQHQGGDADEDGDNHNEIDHLLIVQQKTDQGAFFLVHLFSPVQRLMIRTGIPAASLCWPERTTSSSGSRPLRISMPSLSREPTVT